MRLNRLFAFPLFLVIAAFLRAEVSCPAIFSDHMVLQRERPVAIWGKAAPGEKITVIFSGHAKNTTATAEGNWRIDLDPMPADREPHTLTIRGDNILSFEDVLVGEVWFCSGQSNMEKQLGPRKGQKPTDHYEEAIQQADHPLLRLYQVPKYSKPDEKMVCLRWVACTPETVASTEFSAAAYYFGSELQHELDIPVGLIHSSYGGTMIETWMPPEAFQNTPALAPLLEKKYKTYAKGVQATELFQTMVEPYIPYTLRGFIWYQGESNLMSGDTAIYTLKLRALIESWRARWNEPDAPFNYVLIAPFLYSKRDQDPAQLTDEGLPLFWQAQTAVAKVVPHTGFVSTTDLVAEVKDIHPTNKRDVGLRLAHLALAETYGRSQGSALSPVFTLMKASGNTLALTFANTASGLRSRDDKALDCFQIAGDDKKFFPAEAVIKGHKIIVSSPSVEKPVAIRFGWTETANPNLENSAGLPAIPFRTDDWPVNLDRPAPPPVPASATPANETTPTTK